MLKSNRILALDIGDSELKVAEFTALKSGGLELAKYGVTSLGLEPNTDTQRGPLISAAIRHVLRENNIKPGPVMMSLSGQMVFPRFTKLPPVSHDKVYQIIEYEAQQNVPFPIQQVVWDYQLIGGDQGELYAMLMAIKREMAESIVETVETAGLSPRLIDVAPVALYNTVRYNYGELEGCTMILDMGARTTSLVFVDGGRIFVRSIPRAGNVITQELMKEFGLPFREAEELKLAHAFVAYGGAYENMGNQVSDRVSRIIRSVMTHLHAEVMRSINLYRSQQGGNNPAQVLLCGGTSVIPRTDAFFKEKMKLPVDYLNPFRNVAVSHQIGGEQIGKSAHVMGEVVGLALRGVLTCPVEVDLTPPSLIARQKFRKRLPFLALAGAGLILVVLCWLGYFLRMRGKAEALSKRADERAQQISVVAERLRRVNAEAEEARRKAAALVGLVRQRSVWREILSDVRARMPEGIWVTSLRPSPRTGTEEPVAEGPGARRVRPAGGMPEPRQEDRIKSIEIDGMGFADKADSNTLDLFRNRLRQSPFFTEDSEFLLKPPLGPGHYAWKFSIRLVLKEPLDG